MILLRLNFCKSSLLTLICADTVILIVKLKESLSLSFCLCLSLSLNHSLKFCLSCFTKGRCVNPSFLKKSSTFVKNPCHLPQTNIDLASRTLRHEDYHSLNCLFHILSVKTQRITQIPVLPYQKHYVKTAGQNIKCTSF